MMNNRIKELVEQAGGTYTMSNVITNKNNGLPIDFMEKFAKLIIAECITQIEKNFAGSVHTMAQAHNLAVTKCKQSVKEHFGVE